MRDGRGWRGVRPVTGGDVRSDGKREERVTEGQKGVCDQ